MPDVSVIICTRNPRRGIVDRVVASLASQTLPFDRWETVVIDNGSDPPVQSLGAAKLHGPGCIVESKVGLTNARLRGIQETQGSLLVFVDDDNLLDSDYLEQALRIAEEYPRIGAIRIGDMQDFMRERHRAMEN